MVKQKKKRTKIYSGANAKVTKSSVTHVSAVNRNWIQQWWFDNKRLAKPALIATGIAILVIWLIIELVRAISGSLG
jgi:tryptophan-rich sensory protein